MTKKLITFRSKCVVGVASFTNERKCLGFLTRLKKHYGENLLIEITTINNYKKHG